MRVWAEWMGRSLVGGRLNGQVGLGGFCLG